MAFKSAKAYNEEKYNGKFVLPDDGDTADVIFLYRNYDDVLRADVHYIKSSEYSGYVQCTGRGCPVCATGKIRVQDKLFIPLYNLTTGNFEIWDRNYPFERQLYRDVFKVCDDPVNYVFHITREGAARDMNTKYTITLAGKNSSMPYDKILEQFNLKMPDAYEMICKDFDNAKLQSLLAHQNTASDNDLPDYSVTPRVSLTDVTAPTYEPVPEDATFDDDPDAELDDVNF